MPNFFVSTIFLFLSLHAESLKFPFHTQLLVKLKSSAVTAAESLVKTSTKFDYDSWAKGYQTCKLETVSALEGEIPSDLEGTYFRNGHAKFEVQKEKFLHPFDCDGMVSAINLKDGIAVFRNRFVRTKYYVQELKSKKILFRGAFGTPKSGGMLANMFNLNFRNTANTNIQYWGGRLLALYEGGLPHKMEPDSLRTLGEYTFRGLLKRGEPYCAHPRIDMKANRLVSFSSKQLSKEAELTIFEFDNDLKIYSKRIISIPGFVFLHDFILTDNYYIFYNIPMGFDPTQMILGMKGASDCISFDKSKLATFYVIPRDASKPVIEIPVDAKFSFHFGNGYEDDSGNVVLDIAAAGKEMNLFSGANRKEPIWVDFDFKDAPYTKLYRYVLSPPSTSPSPSASTTASTSWSYTSKQLCDVHLDFPQVNPKVASRKHRFVYATCGSDDSSSTPLQGLIKMDLEEGTDQRWFGGTHEYLGECIFAPRKELPGRPGTEKKTGSNDNEDDGYILTMLINGRDQKSEFLIFDAKNISKGPISRQLLPTFVPHGLHSLYVPGLTFSQEDIVRRFKACLGLESKGWNGVGGGFSGLGLSQTDTVV